MRLNNFLNEKFEEQKNLYKANIVSKRCSEYLNVVKTMTKPQFLHKGSIKKFKDMGFYKPRTNRKPRDIQPDLHKILDKLFFEKFGWKTRSEGIFATPDYYAATKFGWVYVFFPVDGFKFVWSPDVLDLYMDTRYKVSDFYYTHNEKGMEEYLKPFVDTYTDKNLARAIKSYHEIMFKCNSYYAVADKKIIEKLTGIKVKIDFEDIGYIWAE